MINQLINPYQYSLAESNCIITASNNWGSQTNCIKDLKQRLNKHFDTNQSEKCCYCGLLYDRTGRGEIEHIAPKGATLYPQFSFHHLNLAKACQLCNSSSMKHMYNSVIAVGANYENTEFSIVHPYLDDHSQHFGWEYGYQRIIISVLNNSEKAKESIRLFELASEKRTKARAQQRNQERIENLYNITDAIKSRIKNVLKFKAI